LEQVPDGIVSSPAVRAYDTARGAADAGDWKCPIEKNDDLYDTSPMQILEIIRQLDDSRESILLAGHEPTWSDLAGALIGGASMRFPTAAIARIDLDIDSWKQAEFGNGTLVWFVIPKLLSQIGWPDGPKSK
jgi:phosphohistidine phosphatase